MSTPKRGRGRPADTTLDSSIYVRLSSAERDRISEIARADDRTLSAFVRRLILGVIRDADSHGNAHT